MRYLLSIIVLVTISFYSHSQNSPIDFETGGFGADWTWTVFENADNPPLEIIANPDLVGNSSATVAKFTARVNGAPFAGCESQHALDLGIYTLSTENNIISINVWKSNISDVGIKLVTTSGGALIEKKVANTVTDQWEQLVFDFTDYIDNAIYAIEQVDQIVVFPDFEDRSEDRIIYFDNINISSQAPTSVHDLEAMDLQVYPNPASDYVEVRSDIQIRTYRILNAQGKEMITGPLEGGRIELSGLSKGVYVLELLAETDRYQQSLVIR
jgi:hypothetical protein